MLQKKIAKFRGKFIKVCISGGLVELKQIRATGGKLGIFGHLQKGNFDGVQGVAGSSPVAPTISFPDTIGRT